MYCNKRMDLIGEHSILIDTLPIIMPVSIIIRVYLPPCFLSNDRILEDSLKVSIFIQLRSAQKTSSTST